MQHVKILVLLLLLLPFLTNSIIICCIYSDALFSNFIHHQNHCKMRERLKRSFFHQIYQIKWISMKEKEKWVYEHILQMRDMLSLMMIVLPQFVRRYMCGWFRSICNIRKQSFISFFHPSYLLQNRLSDRLIRNFIIHYK